MAFTTAQLEAIERAIAEGVLTVKYQDKQITYRSLDEMVRTLNTMKSSMSSSSKGYKEVKPQFSKGL